jgi:hypothetical protein
MSDTGETQSPKVAPLEVQFFNWPITTQTWYLAIFLNPKLGIAETAQSLRVVSWVNVEFG